MQMEAIRRGRADKYVATICPPERLRTRSPIVDFDRPHAYDKNAAKGASMGGSSAQGSATSKKGGKAAPSPSSSSASLQSRKYQFNNSWYDSYREGGEGLAAAPLGQIKQPPKATSRPAWEKMDRYHKSRNAARDGERYTYVNDCGDRIHRDTELRFAEPPLARQSTDAFVVLPEIKYHTRALDIKKMSRGGAQSSVADKAALRSGAAAVALGSAVPVKAPPIAATVLGARTTLMRGLAAPGRFNVMDH